MYCLYHSETRSLYYSEDLLFPGVPEDSHLEAVLLPPVTSALAENDSL